MKRRMLALTLLSLALMAGAADAKTLEWDRNSETDMKDYQVWMCTTPNCVVVKSAAMLKATVQHPPVGTVPSWPIPADVLEGTVAVSARDQSMNESGLSVPLPFDFKAPVVPANPRLK